MWLQGDQGKMPQEERGTDFIERLSIESNGEQAEKGRGGVEFWGQASCAEESRIE